jgi:hypothetical protein|tara:strand:+ start:738 stop:947 length:210 start_codon:yes stop_codon:yes gene_type:complete
MATKSTHNISLPKSTSSSSMKTKGELGVQGFDDSGPKKSYWQSFMPHNKFHTKRKIDNLYSQKQRKRNA